MTNIINLIAADDDSWEAMLKGVFHDERQRFSAPECYDHDLVDRCGYPLLMELPPSVPGKPPTWFHIYPPERQ